jgi:hypothetical protein
MSSFGMYIAQVRFRLALGEAGFLVAPGNAHLREKAIGHAPRIDFVSPLDLSFNYSIE